jgi:hypothetical protein
VTLRWRTASELATLGFNLYRGSRAHRARVNRKLIAAHRGSGGHVYAYRYRLRAGARTSLYWLQVVDVDGSRSWFGPARAVRAA